MPQGRHDPAIQPITLHNRYQQTWHTIEFSNNRHTRHHPNQRSGSLRSNFSNLPAGLTLVKPAAATFISVKLFGRVFRLTLWTSAEINSTTTRPRWPTPPGAGSHHGRVAAWKSPESQGSRAVPCGSHRQVRRCRWRWPHFPLPSVQPHLA